MDTDRQLLVGLLALQNGLISQAQLLAALRTEPDLDVIRPRPDFQLLLLDLAFPQNPFAP